MGSNGCSLSFGTFDDRRPFVQQSSQGAQQAGLALAALTQKHNVMPGNECAFELGQHGAAKAEDSGPRIATLCQRFQQIVTEFLAQVLEDMAGGTQFTNSKDLRAFSHFSTVDLFGLLVSALIQLQADRLKSGTIAR